MLGTDGFNVYRMHLGEEGLDEVKEKGKDLPFGRGDGR